MIENEGNAWLKQKPQTLKSPDFRHPLTLMWALSHYPLLSLYNAKQNVFGTFIIQKRFIA